MIKTQKKRKITRNKVIGSIQLTIGILLLLISILGLIFIIEQKGSYNKILENNFYSIENKIVELNNGMIPHNNYTKDTYYLILQDEERRLVDRWMDKEFESFQINFYLLIVFLLSILFITQGIVNFGLDKLKDG